jgi:hypothetical protein
VGRGRLARGRSARAPAARCVPVSGTGAPGVDVAGHEVLLRERRDLGGQLLPRCGFEFRRAAAPPAAVVADHVPGDEGRLVVGFREPGLVVVGQVQFVDNVDVGRRAVVEGGEGPVDYLVEVRGRLQQAFLNLLRVTDDRPAVAGTEMLGLQPRHLPERVRPLPGVALDLLWVAGVGCDVM